MRYHFDNALIDNIEILTPEKKAAPEAVITIPAEKLQDKNSPLYRLDEYLISQGFAITPDMENGQPALRVRDIKDKSSLFNALQAGGYVGESVREEATEKDTPPKMSLWQKIRASSLRLSSVFYMLGNVGVFLAGFKRKDGAEMTTGLGFTAGDLMLMAFGKKSGEKQYVGLMRDFRDYLDKNSIAIPEGSVFSATELHKPRSFGDFMRDNIVGFKAISEGVASAAFAVAGMRQNNAKKTLAGILGATGFLGGFLIPEKKNATVREETGKAPLEGTFSEPVKGGIWRSFQRKLQNKPLIFTTLVAGANNVSTLMAAYDEQHKQPALAKVDTKLEGGTVTEGFFRKKDVTVKSMEQRINEHLGTKTPARDALGHFDPSGSHPDVAQAAYAKRWQQGYDALIGEKEALQAKKEKLIRDHDNKIYNWNYLQGGAFLAANTLYGISSKTAGGAKGESPLVDRMTSVAAHVAATQAPEKRLATLSETSKWLAAQPEIDKTEIEVKQLITEKMAMLKHNPWLAKQQVKALDREKSNWSVGADGALHIPQEEAVAWQRELSAKQQQAEHHTAKGDAVESKWRETVTLNEADQAAHYESAR